MRYLLLLLFLVGCASKQKVYTQGAVAADHFLASKAGVELLKQGGNAIDAAVATSFALSVVRPESCGIGGGGFLVIDSPHMHPVALNYRETAPDCVHPSYYETNDSRKGATAVGVPGTVAGLLEAHHRYGLLDRSKVLAPAIQLANSLQANNQANALRAISLQGRKGFYQGEVADAIVQATKGHITHKDLKSYSPLWVKPLLVDIGNGNTLVSMPPPSSGGIAIAQIIALLQRTLLEKTVINEEAYAQLLIESLKHAFADRAEHLADPEFIDVPVQKLLNKEYLDTLASRIQIDKTFNPYAYGSVVVPDDDGTSHLCVVDRGGMMVSLTETINTHFGSGVEVAPFGFMLNNEMDDFSSLSGANIYGLQQSDKNLPEPGKRPLSSMSPTIIEHDGTPFLAVGGSGGPRIISATAQVLLRILWLGEEPWQAVEHTRLHHQWMPNTVYLEEASKNSSVERHLQSIGHQTKDRKDIGVVQVLQVKDGMMMPYSDPRKGGLASGF